MARFVTQPTNPTQSHPTYITLPQLHLQPQLQPDPTQPDPTQPKQTQTPSASSTLRTNFPSQVACDRQQHALQMPHLFPASSLCSYPLWLSPACLHACLPKCPHRSVCRACPPTSPPITGMAAARGTEKDEAQSYLLNRLAIKVSEAKNLAAKDV